VPKVSRSWEYRSASSIATRPTPRARDATCIRPISSPRIIWAKPLPSCSPSNVEAGTRKPSNRISQLCPLVAELGRVLRDGQALALLDHQDADAGVGRLGRRVGLAQQRDQVGAAGVRDPRLRAVHHVAVAVAASHGTNRLQVRTAAGLGQRHRRPEFTGRHSGQVPVLLFLGAEGQQQLGHVAIPEPWGDVRVSTSCYALVTEELARGWMSLAGAMGGHTVVDAELLHLLDEFLGVDVVVLQVAHDRLDLAINEVTHQFDYGGLFITEIERDDPSPS
jgi:hypothetical protein